MSEVPHKLEDRAAGLRPAAALRVRTTDIAAAVGADGPRVRQVIACGQLGQARPIVEVDERNAAELHVVNECIPPIGTQEDLLPRHGLLLVIGEAANVPALARIEVNVALCPVDGEPAFRRAARRRRSLATPYVTSTSLAGQFLQASMRLRGSANSAIHAAAQTL